MKRSPGRVEQPGFHAFNTSHPAPSHDVSIVHISVNQPGTAFQSISLAQQTHRSYHIHQCLHHHPLLALHLAAGPPNQQKKMGVG